MNHPDISIRAQQSVDNYSYLIIRIFFGKKMQIWNNNISSPKAVEVEIFFWEEKEKEEVEERPRVDFFLFFFFFRSNHKVRIANKEARIQG